MNKLIGLLSWRNWGMIRYNSVRQSLAVLFYIALIEQLFSFTFIAQVVVFFLFSTVMTAFGYLVNDLSDIELDRAQGKRNAFQNTSRKQALLILLAVLAVGSLLGFPFLSRPGFLLLWLVWVMAASLYSLPPLRLKERGLPGLLATVAAQQTLPAALLFIVFGQLVSWGALILVAYATVRGFSSDISHQLRDRPTDSRANSGTFAVRHSPDRIRQVYAASLELERLTLGLAMLLFLRQLPTVALPFMNWQVSIAWPLFLFFLPLFIITAGSSWKSVRNRDQELQDPYDEKRQAHVRDPLHVIHHPFPSVITPLYLVLWMSFFYWPNLVFILILGLIYGLYSPRRWVEAWPLQPLLALLRAERG